MTSHSKPPSPAFWLSDEAPPIINEARDTPIKNSNNLETVDYSSACEQREFVKEMSVAGGCLVEEDEDTCKGNIHHVEIVSMIHSVYWTEEGATSSAATSILSFSIIVDLIFKLKTQFLWNDLQTMWVLQHEYNFQSVWKKILISFWERIENM